MIYKVLHKTAMRYATPVRDARFNLRLKPYAWQGHAVSQASITIAPKPARIAETAGPYLVNTMRAEYDSDLEQLEITSSFTVDVAMVQPAHAGPPITRLRQAALASRDLSPLSPAPYLFSSRIAGADPAIGAWAQEGMLAGDPAVLDLARALTSKLYREFAYQPGATTSATPPIEAFHARHGVCQDFAHILIMALRWLGIPAAYASGYLRTLPPPGQVKLMGADAMHAWVNVWCGDELGWVGIDPTNDCLAGTGHVQIAAGRDYADVAPIDGTFIGAAPQRMGSSVDVMEVG